MKKFLQLNTRSDQPAIPPMLDTRILAAAAFKAHAIRQRRKIFHWVLPAAAAFMLISGTVFFNFDFTTSTVPNKPAAELSSPEILALSDMTALEQENFTVAIISEYDFSSDSNFVI